MNRKIHLLAAACGMMMYTLSARAANIPISTFHYYRSKGTYVLTGNLTSSSAGNAISVGMGIQGPIIVDLKGFTISIRGSGNLENDTIAGTELVVDGIPINQADGEAYLQDLDLNSVKFAEVYRGADAFRFGGVTLGGSINFITYTGRDLPSPFNIRLSGGSFGLREQSFQAGWASGPWDLYLSGIDHTLEGFRDWSQEDYQKLAASVGYRFNDSIQNRFYLFLGRLDQNNPSSLTKEEMNANPQQTEPESVEEKWNTYWAYLRLMDRFLIQGADWTLS